MSARARRAWAVAYLVLVLASVATVVWAMRYSYAINKLTRGVGDTVFYGADGRPWFRMDEQRRDVPLGAISRRPPARHHRGRGSPLPPPSRRGSARRSSARRSRNVRDADTVEGGSTITQQLARTLFLSNRRTYGRKIKEAGIALLLEAQLTKAQILELYLNRVYLCAGGYGVEPMSRNLFGKPAKDVTLAEAALIAGLIRAPSALSPWSNLDGAAAPQPRRAGADARARLHHAAAGGRRARAGAHARPAVSRGRRARGGYAKEFLRQQFRNALRRRSPARLEGPHDVRPRSAGSGRARGRDGLRRSNRPSLQAALVALDPATGDILAHGRRPRLPRVHVQSRHAEPASARLRVQAVRVRRRAGSRVHAGVGARRA